MVNFDRYLVVVTKETLRRRLLSDKLIERQSSLSSALSEGAVEAFPVQQFKLPSSSIQLEFERAWV